MATARPVVHCFQHSERVQPLTVLEWARERDVELRITRVDLEPLPPAETIERLVVLGGQMNTDEAHAHPWLDAERELLGELVRRPTPPRILGICLGSQLLAEVLGGRVTRATEPEIGWQRVQLTDDGRRSSVFAVLGGELDVFEWHGDTWTLPPGAQLTVTSEGCVTQAFSWGERVHAVQFHPEFTAARTRELAATTTDDLDRGGWVQRPETFFGAAGDTRFDRLARYCRALLDAALDVSPSD